MKPNLSLTSERIRKIIESKGLTLERFGDLIGDTPISSVNNWLRGVSLPNKNRLLTIANIGNTSVDWIKWGTLEEYIASYLIDSGYELYIKDFPEIPYKVFKDIQEKYSDTFSLDKDYELLNPIIKFTIGGVTLNKIKFYIDSSKKTIKQISTETGINYTTLTNYYRGERNPRNTETWNILADYFHVPVSYLMGLDETNSIEQPNLDRIKTARLEKKDKIVKNIASLDSDYFTELSNLYFSMTSLLEVKLQEDDSDFLFLKSILEDSFEYTILFAKQKKFINKALNLNIDERKELESELFGNLTQVQVNNLKREITARLISKLQ